nr:MAG TPA: hypothetical protein [Caudoviricetes sp.]
MVGMRLPTSHCYPTMAKPDEYARWRVDGWG